MANWQRTLNLSDVWKKAKEREITAKELAIIIIANRLKRLREFNDEEIDMEKEELINRFEFFEEDGSYNDLDYYLNALYNWGDISLDNIFGGKKVCWIER